MCGIAGHTGARDGVLLDSMVASLVHRGPDDAGSWLGDGVALGMRRLAIVDVAAGSQPAFNEDRSVVVVFNGEIYNHRALRAELVERGHVFRSDHSDTETLVHLYEEHGPGFVSRLNGMFALALWDRTARRLLLARDHAGIKPLYYAETGDSLAFASEIKALLRHSGVDRAVDPESLHHYFSLKNVPAPATAFARIRQLRPGEMLLADADGVRIETWWKPVFAPAGRAVDEDAPRRLLALLQDAVQLQMEADVPVGAYLSGGVDSSAVVALMARQGGGRVKTFTLVYDDRDLAAKDEDRRHARLVSDLFATEHHEQTIRPADLPEAIDGIVAAFDEPFSGVVSTYFLTSLIARHVKVALSGDGADELFASYAAHRLAVPILRAGDPAARPDEVTAGLSEHDRGIARRMAEASDPAAARMLLALRSEAEKATLYSARMRELVGSASTERLVRTDLRADGGDPLNAILALDQATLLPDQVLAFVDRLSMAHSVEVRPPFLDPRIVAFANALPGRQKIAGGVHKAVLKAALADVVPAEVLHRRKEGFLMPINHWLARDLAGWMESVLAPPRLARHGLIDPERMAATIAGFRAAPDNKTGDKIWNVMMFQLWWDMYIHG